MIKLKQEKDWVDVQLVNDKGRVYASFPVYDVPFKELKRQLETDNSELRKKVEAIR